MHNKNWYNKSKEEVFKEFEISEEMGLSDEQVIKNREKYGSNELQAQKKKSLFVKFLEQFKIDFIERIKKKEQLKHITREKQKLNSAYIFFAYMNKADIALKNQQYELSIKTMDYAYEKFLKKFPMTSVVYKRGNELIIKGKEKITSIIQEKLTKWLIDVNKEE